MSQSFPIINNNDNDIMQEKYLYCELDSYRQENNSIYIAAEGMLPLAAADQSSRSRRREQKQSRWNAEQSIRVREIFGLSQSDNVVASFSAALLNTILLQGRMYITTYHLCFFTKLFGRVTNEAFPYTSLAKVEKRRGGLVANAIKIYFADEDVHPVIIGSLNHRERAFGLIQERLRTINPNAAETLPEDDNGSTGSVASAPLERDDVPTTSARSVCRNSTPLPVLQHNTFANSTPELGNDGASPERNQSKSQLIRIERDEKLDGGTLVPDEEDKIESDEWLSSLVWCTPDDIVGQLVANTYDKKAERARIILKAPVKEVFNMLFISDWVKEYHEDVSNHDVEIGKWQRDEDGSMCRDVNFRRPIKYRVGPKETRVNEKQRYSFTDEDGVIIEIQGKNLDVPCASYFVVESFFEMSPVNHGKETLLVASVAVHFLKSTFLQGQIESGTMTETKTAYGRLLNLAERKVDKHVVERAVNQNPSKAIQMHRRKDADGRVVDPGLSEPETDQIVRGADSGVLQQSGEKSVVQDKRVATFEQNKLGCSNEEVGREKVFRLAQERTSAWALSGGDIRMQDGDGAHNFFTRATFLLLALVCIFVLIAVIFLIRIHLLQNSLENVIRRLKDIVDDKQC